MPEGPATILGGLPVIADVWFSGPDYWGEYDAGVTALYWMKSDGTKGKPLPQTIWDRLEKHPYWDCDVTESVSDHIAYLEWKADQIKKGAGG